MNTIHVDTSKKYDVIIGGELLDKAGEYISVDKSGFINLTQKGIALAEELYERHTILTDLLISLGVDPDVAAVDACKIEHVISADSFEAIKNYISNK